MTHGAALLWTAANAGVEICFANPGTTELPLVLAFDEAPGVRPVLCLFEGVCTGAADGYGRMKDLPALTLLHLGPGFANGIANVHNANRACSPLVNIIGDHASWHRAANAPLQADIESLARPVSSWVRTTAAAPDLGKDMAEAILAARTPPGQVATLIAANDYLLGTGGIPFPALPVPGARALDQAAIDAVAKALRSRQPAAMLLGGPALRERPLRAAGRIAEKTGCRLFSERAATRLERGAGLPEVERFAYFPEQALGSLKDVRRLILAGTGKPVAFFGYPGKPSYLVPDGVQVDSLAAAGEDVAGALEALAEALGADSEVRRPAALQPPAKPSGRLTPETLAAAIAAVQPENAIVVDESITNTAIYFDASARSPRHSYLYVTGGAIGFGMPAATGAAVACPERAVINIEADGSAMYTLQSLWTQAREQLNVTTIICANRVYKILAIEVRRAGIETPGPRTARLADLSDPPLDWVHLARGMGVPAVAVDSADSLAREIERALAEPGPHLIEAVL